MVTFFLFNLNTRSCFSKSGDIIVTMSHAPVYQDAIAAILWCDNPVFSCSRPQSRQHKVMEASCRYNCRADRTVGDLEIPSKFRVMHVKKKLCSVAETSFSTPLMPTVTPEKETELNMIY